jgi:S-adenosylmethionine decarboxylase proenzyme
MNYDDKYQEGITMERTDRSLESFHGKNTKTILGTHLIVELWSKDPQILDDQAYLHKSLQVAAELGKFTVISIEMHKFSPQGVTGVVLLAESHMSIHTWPEYCYAALDIFACSGDPWSALQELKERLLSYKVEVYTMHRGNMMQGE